MHKKDTVAFKKAAKELELSPQVDITHHNMYLNGLTSDIKFDCVVSPANSYGLLDGGFDDAISRAFSPAHEYYALTRHVQAELYKTYRGFAPPGSCMMISIPKEYAEQSKLTDRWGCRWLALCPTMRTPDVVDWDREIVYDCVWSLLCALDRHNQVANAASDPEVRGSVINTILMTPLATGVGRISGEKWANQLVLALNHYISAIEKPAEWSSLEWDQAADLSKEVEDTHDL
jgi:O-acetyl-ADP-ribose deacetylase (regulator of RNase III)